MKLWKWDEWSDRKVSSFENKKNESDRWCWFLWYIHAFLMRIILDYPLCAYMVELSHVLAFSWWWLINLPLIVNFPCYESQMAYMFWVQGYKLGEAHDLLLVTSNFFPLTLKHKWILYALTWLLNDRNRSLHMF